MIFTTTLKVNVSFISQLAVIMVGVITFIIQDFVRSIVIGLPTGHNDWEKFENKGDNLVSRREYTRFNAID